MLQSGEDGPLLQLMPPQSERFGVVRQAQTAVGRMRTKRAGTDRNRSQNTYNSLNLTGGLAGMGLSMREDQAPVLLGRIEQNKFTTQYDVKMQNERDLQERTKADMKSKIDRLYMPISEQD